MKKPREIIYFCIDCESSGPVPQLFNLISLGVVAVHKIADGDQAGRHRTGASKYWEIKTTFPGWEEEAERVHKLKRENLDKNGQDPRQVLEELRSFTLGVCANGEKPLFVGHNAPFDWMFVNWYFHNFGVENPFGYNALDTKAMATGKHRLSWPDSNKEKLLELYPKLKAPAEHMVHNALADAEFQAEILIALLDD